MKKAVLIIALLLSYQMQALHIHSVIISAVADSLNVSLNTEAEELYYFHSWHYSFSEDTIAVEACFVSGFGSAISPLNNNFTIPISQPDAYRLVVRIYYTDLHLFYNPENLQDEQSGLFNWPLSGTVSLSDQRLDKGSEDGLFFPNPTSGIIYIPKNTQRIQVFDALGRNVAVFENVWQSIDLSDFADGIYHIQLFQNQQSKTRRLILKKGTK